MSVITTIFKSGLQILTVGQGSSGFDAGEISTEFGGQFQPAASGSGPSGPYVSSWMGRTGTITSQMVATDIVTALNYTPANVDDVQALLDFFQTYASQTGVALNNKVDKVTGYGLSQTNFTQAEKDKLAGITEPNWRGTHLTEAALKSAVPVGRPGDEAHVDPGEGTNALLYIWDESDQDWVLSSITVEGSGGDSAAQIKVKYESNPDTNAFTDNHKIRLEGLPPAALSGFYGDLSGLPTLGTVASTNSYNDLSDKPLLTDLALTASWHNLLDIPFFSLVAFSNDYNDLSNKPTIASLGGVSTSTYTTGMGNKVDKVSGKGLSTNDYDATAVANLTKALAAKIEVALSDEATALTTGTKITMHVTTAMTLTEVFGGLSTVQTGGTLLAFDVKKNGTTVFTTKPTFDNGEETTLTAATAAAINGTISLAKGDRLTFSIDAIGDGTAKGLKVYLLGTR